MVVVDKMDKKETRVPSKEVRIIGNVLLYVGIIGFFFFFATTKRMIDASIYYFAFVAVIGWFILQMKLWARKAAIIVFSIYAFAELAGFIILGIATFFDPSFHQPPFVNVISHFLWLAFSATFVFLLMKKSVKKAFLASRVK